MVFIIFYWLSFRGNLGKSDKHIRRVRQCSSILHRVDPKKDRKTHLKCVSVVVIERHAYERVREEGEWTLTFSYSQFYSLSYLSSFVHVAHFISHAGTSTALPWAISSSPLDLYPFDQTLKVKSTILTLLAIWLGQAPL